MAIIRDGYRHLSLLAHELPGVAEREPVLDELGRQVVLFQRPPSQQTCRSERLADLDFKQRRMLFVCISGLHRRDAVPGPVPRGPQMTG